MMTSLCLKHKLYTDYSLLFLEHGILWCTSKSRGFIWVVMLEFFSDGIDKAWTGYVQSECTCHHDSPIAPAASTIIRMGASWASSLGPGDVGNLNDFEEYPDDLPPSRFEFR